MRCSSHFLIKVSSLFFDFKRFSDSISYVRVFRKCLGRLTAIIKLKCLNFCSHLLYNVYQSCESEYIKFTNLNGFYVLPYWSATKLSFKNKSFSYLKKLKAIDE